MKRNDVIFSERREKFAYPKCDRKLSYVSRDGKLAYEKTTAQSGHERCKYRYSMPRVHINLHFFQRQICRFTSQYLLWLCSLSKVQSVQAWTKNRQACFSCVSWEAWWSRLHPLLPYVGSGFLNTLTTFSQSQYFLELWYWHWGRRSFHSKECGSKAWRTPYLLQKWTFSHLKTNYMLV